MSDSDDAPSRGVAFVAAPSVALAAQVQRLAVVARDDGARKILHWGGGETVIKSRHKGGKERRWKRTSATYFAGALVATFCVDADVLAGPVSVVGHALVHVDAGAALAALVPGRAGA